MGFLKHNISLCNKELFSKARFWFCMYTMGKIFLSKIGTVGLKKEKKVCQNGYVGGIECRTEITPVTAECRKATKQRPYKLPRQEVFCGTSISG
jgi:hypothetical protein